MGSPSWSPGAQGRGALPRADARHHGDQAAADGMLDFAVDVRGVEPPSWLVEPLAARLGDLGRYPSERDHRRATDAAAGVPIAHVVLEAPFTLSAADVPDEADLVVDDAAPGESHSPACDDLRDVRAAVRPEWPTMVEALVQTTAGEVPR